MSEATLRETPSRTLDAPSKRSAGPALTSLTRPLLVCGLIAGPFYVVIGLIQALTRPGFNLLRHDLSLLANGEFG